MQTEPAKDPDHSGGDARPAPRHVGEVLRQRREELGYRLPDLAKGLRIRLPYLEAIEQGRWNDLPGQAYITGFLRSYAAALGLDATLILGRFKQDSTGIEQPSELYFPEPVDENRMPGGAVILVAVLLAAVAYGGYYALQSTDRAGVEAVPSLPDRLSALIYGEETEQPAVAPAPVLEEEQVAELIGQSQPTAPEVGATNAPAVAPAPELPPDAPSALLRAGSADAPTDTAAAPGEEAAGDEESDAVPLPDLGTPMPTAPDAVDPAPTPAPTTPPGETATAAAPAPTVEAAPAADVAALPAAPATAEPTPEAAPAAASPPPAAAPAQTPPPGRVFGQTDGDVRVTVRATDDSWVEIRDARGTLWAARNLRPGDVFRAPAVPGLTMLTGNAGGVVIAVDGQELPLLGSPGQVVRGVELSPEALQARLPRP